MLCNNRRMLRKLPSLLLETSFEWIEDNGPTLAAALAYYTLISLAPLLLLVAGIAGYLSGDAVARESVISQIRSFSEVQVAEAADSILKAAAVSRDGTFFDALLGIIPLLIGASGVLHQVRESLNLIWNVRLPAASWTHSLKRRLLSFALVMAAGALAAVSLTASTALSAASDRIASWLLIAPPILQFWNQLISFSLLVLLFSLMFRYLADVRFPWMDTVAGALTAALLFTAGKSAIALYLGKSGATSIFGAAGSVVAVMIWIYYSTLIFFFGAELTQVLARNRAAPAKPQDASTQTAGA